MSYSLLVGLGVVEGIEILNFLSKEKQVFNNNGNFKVTLQFHRHSAIF